MRPSRKTIFRIVKRDIPTDLTGNPNIYRYRIEQRYNFVLVRWWSTPEFAPPHNFVTKEEAIEYIKLECKDPIIYERL